MFNKKLAVGMVGALLVGAIGFTVLGVEPFFTVKSVLAGKQVMSEQEAMKHYADALDDYIRASGTIGIELSKGLVSSVEASKTMQEVASDTLGKLDSVAVRGLSYDVDGEGKTMDELTNIELLSYVHKMISNRKDKKIWDAEELMIDSIVARVVKNEINERLNEMED